MSGYRLPWRGIVGILSVLLSAITPAQAEVPLTRADIEAVYNHVDILLQGGISRPVRLSDWLSTGDAVRTAPSSRVDLRFNDGSLARIGEQATFWFVPNTRNFRLSNGTALLLIPPGHGPSTIETPSVVTGIQGTALIVRHVPVPQAGNAATPPGNGDDHHDNPGRTVVMVLTNNPQGPVEVQLRNGRKVSLNAGQMAIAEGGNLYLFEFDLELFYQTSPLVQDLHLDDPTYVGTGLPTDPVRQETLEGLASQPAFEGGYWLNPDFFSPTALLPGADGWLLPAHSPSNSASVSASEERSLNPVSMTHFEGTRAPAAGSLPGTPPDASAFPNPELGANRMSNSVLPPGLLNPVTAPGLPLGAEPVAADGPGGDDLVPAAAGPSEVIPGDPLLPVEEIPTAPPIDGGPIAPDDLPIADDPINDDLFIDNTPLDDDLINDDLLDDDILENGPGVDNPGDDGAPPANQG